MNDLIPRIPTTIEIQLRVFEFIQDRLGNDANEDTLFMMPDWLSMYLSQSAYNIKDMGMKDPNEVAAYLCASAFIVGLLSEENNWDTSLPGVGNE